MKNYFFEEKTNLFFEDGEHVNLLTLRFIIRFICCDSFMYLILDVYNNKENHIQAKSEVAL